MNFKPKSEQECGRLLPEGIFDFEIMDAKEKVSKSGNDMIELKLAIWEGESISCYLFDYLLESVAYKLRHCAEACGLLEQYEAGTLQAGKLIGKTGRVKISIQKDKTDQYPDKNNIKDYLTKDKSASVPAKDIQPTIFSDGSPVPSEDDLPF